MTCPGCGQENPAGVKFCRHCGHRLESEKASGWSCDSCGRENRSSAKFCAGCGLAPAAESGALSSEPVRAAVAAGTCPYCDTPVTPGRRFCRGCGAPVDDSAGARAAVSSVRDTEAAENPEASVVDGAAAIPEDPSADPMPAPSPSPASVEPSGPPGLPDVSPDPAEAVAPHATAALPVADKTRQQTEAHATEFTAPSSRQAAVSRAAPSREEPVGLGVASVEQASRDHGGRSRMVWVVLGIVVVVVAVGTFVALRLGRPPDTVALSAPAAGGSSAQAVEPDVLMQGRATETSKDRVEQMPPAAVAAGTPGNARTSAGTESAPKVAAPAPPHEQAPTVVASDAMKPAADGESATRPVPPRRVPAPATSKPRDMGGVAQKLTQAGEADFNRQDYSAAIANAKAALAVDPSNSRAQRLLREAQLAQQKAMNSISIQ